MTRHHPYQYRLTRSQRRTLSLIVHEDQTIEVRSPLHLTRQQIDRFIAEKTDWIEKKRQESQQTDLIPRQTEQRQKEAAQILEQELNEALKSYQGPQPRRLLLRDLTSRWGSCSSRQTISLNLRLAELPPLTRRYVIFHELCHLQEMNHSQRFWRLLEQYVPNAKNIRQTMNRQYRLRSK